LRFPERKQHGRFSTDSSEFPARSTIKNPCPELRNQFFLQNMPPQYTRKTWRMRFQEGQAEKPL
jgi:hypothetical protein